MPDPDVTIIITCGPGLGLYLPDALESARRQTTRCEIVVVFDRCRPPLDRVRLDDVTIYRCEFGNVQQARRAGLTCAHGQAVLFLDADNRLPPGFCDQAFRQLQRVSRADPRIAGIYPAIEYFDPQWKPHSRGKLSPPVWTREQFERHPGFQDACTLVWRHALEVSWTETVGHDCLEDHHMWSQLVRQGWTFCRGDAGIVLHYRVRSDSMSATEHAKDYATRFALHAGPVTHFVPLAGGQRMLLWPRLRDWLLRTDRRHPIWLCDASGDDETWNQLSRSMGMFLATHDDVRLFRHPVQRSGLADEDRTQAERSVNQTVAHIYNRMAQEITTPLVLVLEDDILPRGAPAAVLRTLVDGLTDRVSAVSGYYKSRLNANAVAWRSGFGRQLVFVEDKDLSRAKREYLPVSGSGFGCLLIRREALRSIPQSVTTTEPWYDPRFFRQLTEQHQECVLARSVACEHRSVQRVDG